MKCVRRNKLFARMSIVAMTTGLLVMFSAPIQAVPSFSRETGAACNKCHSMSFPRLNSMGERFMRNGFQLPAEEGLEIGFPVGEETPGKTKELKDLLIKNIGEILSIRGKFDVFKQKEGDSASTIAKPQWVQFFVGATLAKDVPVWVEAEIDNEGEASVPNYFIGRTNIMGSTWANVRIGLFTPTEWTSYSDQKRSLDSANTHPGAYRGKGGHTQVGEGLGSKRAIEYYGYNDNFLVAVGLSDGSRKSAPESDKDVWIVGRVDFLKGSSVSFLYVNGGGDTDSYTLSGNYRMGKTLDVRAQYSWDNSGKGAVDDIKGYTLQADYQFLDHWMGIVRYDTTDNGRTSNSEETQVTAAMVWAPYQNAKLTAYYVAELDRAEYSGSKQQGTEETDQYGVQLQFAF